MQPGRFTELFFLDEATGFAAGHRPCRMCRHDDYAVFVEAWSSIHPGQSAKADAIDGVLHAERWDTAARRQRHHYEPWRSLPDGAFVERDRDAWLVLDGRLLRWTPAGYTEARPRPSRGEASVITPPSLVGFLRTEREPLVPFLHPSAHARTRYPTRMTRRRAVRAQPVQLVSVPPGNSASCTLVEWLPPWSSPPPAM